MTITSNTTAPELAFAKAGAAGILRHLSPAYLIEINAAYRAFRAFKALDAERLADLGISREEQDAATLADFRDMPSR